MSDSMKIGAVVKDYEAHWIHSRWGSTQMSDVDYILSTRFQRPDRIRNLVSHGYINSPLHEGVKKHSGIFSNVTRKLVVPETVQHPKVVLQRLFEVVCLDINCEAAAWYDGKKWFTWRRTYDYWRKVGNKVLESGQDWAFYVHDLKDPRFLPTTDQWVEVEPFDGI